MVVKLAFENLQQQIYVVNLVVTLTFENVCTQQQKSGRFTPDKVFASPATLVGILKSRRTSELTTRKMTIALTFENVYQHPGMKQNGGESDSASQVKNRESQSYGHFT